MPGRIKQLLDVSGTRTDTVKEEWSYSGLWEQKKEKLDLNI